MKRGRIFVMTCVVLCAVFTQQVNAVPHLDLWMEFDSGSSTVEVHRTNTDFGLGSLTYDLVFSESLNLTREYSDYGWTANDGLFDSSSPADGSSGSFDNIRFNTVHSPAGSEFSPGSGIVESFEITSSDSTPRWIYFSISSPIATNGNGENLVSGLGGSLSVLPDVGNYTLGVYIPEPASLTLFALGCFIAIRKKR
ncbi:MAG: hypothetical protein JW749_08895 [Sedimentisphaerales bacterium]|nr:hypothetical protein [Sedimentisphaerales bacterium]